MTSKDYPEYLSETDLRSLDSSNYENQLRTLEARYLTEKRAKMKLELELLSAQVLLLEKDMVAKQNVHLNKVGNHKKFMAELRERYGISKDSSFGHDPLTGKLHISRSK